MQAIYGKSKKKIRFSCRFWITMVVLTTKSIHRVKKNSEKADVGDKDENP